MTRQKPTIINEVVCHEQDLLYKSNNFGDFKILKYEGSRNITIQFVNTGNIYTTQKHAIHKGFVCDVLEKYRLIEEGKQEVKKARTKKLQDLEKERQLKEYIKEQQKEARKKENKERLLLLKQQKFGLLQNLIGNKYMHDYFGEYIISDYKRESYYEITFTKTGNKYTRSIKSIESKKVCDTDESGNYKKLLSREWYVENRDKVLDKAKQWQKDNVEKTRVRNANRRCKRKEAEGEYKLKDVELLLEKQDNKCNHCQDELTLQTRHVDHIMPIVLGGDNLPNNLQILCQYCNNSKGGKHPDMWKQITSHQLWWDTKNKAQGK